MEDIRLGLEANESANQQRRIAGMRFLGELYAYRVVDSALVFDTLHLLLFFGIHTPQVRLGCRWGARDVSYSHFARSPPPHPKRPLLSPLPSPLLLPSCSIALISGGAPGIHLVICHWYQRG